MRARVPADGCVFTIISILSILALFWIGREHWFALTVEGEE